MILKDLNPFCFQQIEHFQDTLINWREDGYQIIFTNGCFDLIHPGHIHNLIEARKMGDKLIVGLNSDVSIKRLKGPERPIQSESSRANILAAFRFVDAVILFQENTPHRLLEMIKPKVWVKGGDYEIENLSGKEIVKSYGGQIHIVKLLPEHSSSSLIGKILSIKEK